MGVNPLESPTHGGRKNRIGGHPQTLGRDESLHPILFCHCFENRPFSFFVVLMAISMADSRGACPREGGERESRLCDGDGGGSVRLKRT
jgi:hypothetical protein